MIVATGHLIRNAAGRQDLHLMVDGSLVDRTLTYSSSGQWEDASVHWTGPVAGGEHTVHLQSPQANVWGCQDQWGDLDVLVLPATVTGVATYQTPDTRSGWRAAAAANSPLISNTFTADLDSVLSLIHI